MLTKIGFLTASVLFTVLCKFSSADACYFPFLQAGSDCSTDADCGGSPCVMDINISKKVCCNNKPGTVAPKCPGGSSYSDLPILCEGNDGCPTGYKCSPSTTSFTKDSASPNSLCCKS